jgi:hypothetical protein
MEEREGERDREISRLRTEGFVVIRQLQKLTKTVDPNKSHQAKSYRHVGDLPMIFWHIV